MNSASTRALVFLTFACFTFTPLMARSVSFEERVLAQEAIERVYYSHQVDATRPFDQAVPRRVIESKVRNLMAQSAALEKLWHTSVTSEALDQEIARIARNTRFPERLLQVYRALGEDPVLIRECFARPILVERLTGNFFAFDSRFQGPARVQASDLLERLHSGRLDLKSSYPGRWLTEIQKQKPGRIPSELRERMGRSFEPGFERRVVGPEEYMVERGRLPRNPGEFGPLTETRDEFDIQALLEEGPDRLLIATYSIPKQSWDSWWQASRDQFESSRLATVAGDATLPVPTSRFASSVSNDSPTPESNPVVPDDTWQNGILDGMPDGRHSHSAVWTGSRMIVWGGNDYRYLDTGSLYDPLTDTWSPTSRSGAPAPRAEHTAVWTGTQMIIWGGINGPGNSFLNSGGRYDPATDTWTPTSTTGAPQGRTLYSAIWTGGQMIIWGGSDNVTGANTYLNTGGRYDPATDTWTPTSMVNVPAPREAHSAVWTGGLMVVWGGHNPSSLSTGGRYDPATDSWTPTAVGGAPSARLSHSAVWTGGRMIIWGGGWPMTNTGGRYDPVADSWQSTSVVNAPTVRRYTTVVWTGNQMLVWGGTNSSGDGQYNTGARYDPVADLWTPITTTGAPSARGFHTAIWTGSHFVVWGGSTYSPPSEIYTGGRYDPATDTWTPTSTGSAPSPRSQSTSVWTGNKMIVWGGAPYALNTGGKYDPLVDDWTPTSIQGAPDARSSHTATWTGNLMVVWGGFNQAGSPLSTGGRYDPATDAWTPTSVSLAPTARSNHTAVWTGSELLVWGGRSGGELNTGGRYDPSSDSWTAISAVNAPSVRTWHTAIWTGSLMIVWGGDVQGAQLDTGGRYDPVGDLWLPVSTLNAPSPRRVHTAVWTGSKMVVWGGYPYSEPSVGGRYDPVSDSWAYTSIVNAPSTRAGHSAIWTGSKMVVWGGFSAEAQNTGGRYDPFTDTWTPTSTVNSPLARVGHVAVWTGESMIVWGGFRSFPLCSGGRYFATESNADGDSVPPGVDNCPSIHNPGQEDADLDGRGDPCDCAPNDSSAFAAPAEITGLRWDSQSLLRWNPLQMDCGTGILYDVIRGDLGGIGGAGSPVCQAPGTAQTSLEDSTVPPAAGFYYLARGTSSCGQGTFGVDSSGHERQSPACP
jgi:N-acetylneuraminic acid mutarotase